MTARLSVSLGVGVAMLAAAGAVSAQSRLDVLHAFASQGATNPTAPLIQATDGNFYGTTYGRLGTVFRMTPAGTVTVLHHFVGGPDGERPKAALVQATDGNFYGTTESGGGPGSNSGTVFRMTPDGTVTILHAFGSGSTGYGPRAALIQATDGNFYGTTSFGGASNDGTTFKMAPDGTFTVLHSFAVGIDGSIPDFALIQATDGNFYGTTAVGGAFSVGTIFRMTPGGTVTVLHTFNGDGAFPSSPLIQATDGNFYGTTGQGGASNKGTVYRMTPDGTVTILHAFGDGSTGYGPRAALIQATDGNFYGTTAEGGTSGSGTAFQMTFGGTVTVLHTFTSGGGIWAGPVYPYAALIQATDGNLYGTTRSGGPSDLGTVFQMTTSGTFTSMHAFTLGTGAANPWAPVIEATDGNFYGTTLFGGASDLGTIFRMSPAGVVTVLHAFTGGTDGASPSSALIQATDRNFYGTTDAGGASNNGTIFKMTPSGTVSILHAFLGGIDGASPPALIEGTDGNFYGTTVYGGASGLGTVFQMTPGGSVTVLHAFTGGAGGASPKAPLIQATDGNFYGTTYGGGTLRNFGTAFQLTPGGSFTVLHAFDGTDGAYPYSALIEATDGNLYGTTAEGGGAIHAECVSRFLSGCGSVFQIATSGAFTVLYSFAGGTDGQFPYAALAQGTDGNLYGTTHSGGTSGAGMVFQMTTSGALSVLHAFSGGTDGARPYSSLIQATDGNFYGTASSGGAAGTGVVFRLTLLPAATTLISPHGTIPANLPTYAWQPVDKATAYYLQVHNSSGVPVIQAQYGAASCVVSVCSVTPAVPLVAGTYTWRVQTWNNGGYGPSSTPLTFTVGLPTKHDGDLDGDGKADITVYRPSNGVWYVLGSGTNYATYIAYQWGVSTDLPVPADYDGDGQADIAVYRPATGSWYVLLSSTNFTTWVSYQWGVSTDTPVPGDYDGDGKADIAIYRPAMGSWYVLLSTTNSTSYVSYQWGASTDIPLPRDYDGDGRVDIAVYRPATGAWYVLLSSTNFATFISYQFGVSTDVPVPADYDGDGKTDIAVYRPINGGWYLLLSGTVPATDISYQFGISTDIPVPGDYDGDAKADIAVYRPGPGYWYVLLSSTGSARVNSYQWGVSTDVPVLGHP